MTRAPTPSSSAVSACGAEDAIRTVRPVSGRLLDIEIRIIETNPASLRKTKAPSGAKYLSSGQAGLHLKAPLRANVALLKELPLNKPRRCYKYFAPGASERVVRSRTSALPSKSL